MLIPAFVFFGRVPTFGHLFVMRMFAFCGTFMIGMILPEYVLAWLSRRRRNEISLYLPDALDLLVICTNAGNSLGVSIRRVADEMKIICPPLCDEFSLAADELKLSGDSTRALNNLADRIDLPSQEQVDAYLPPFEPRQVLDPGEPVSIGAMVGPEAFMEVRYLAHHKQIQALEMIPALSAEFKTVFGRDSGGLLRAYRTEDADTVIVAVLGIIYATIRSAALFQYFTITQMAWASDRQSLEQKRLGEEPNVDSEIANTDASMSQSSCQFGGPG